jgi:hypothetical protein
MEVFHRNLSEFSVDLVGNSTTATIAILGALQATRKALSRIKPGRKKGE